MNMECSNNLFFTMILRSLKEQYLYKVYFWQISGALICKKMCQISSFGNTVLQEFALSSVHASRKMSHVRS